MLESLTGEKKAKLTQYHQTHQKERLTAAYQEIGDMTYQYAADIGLAYASPVRGVWNIVHIGTLVPGGHQVFVCPTSCLRGVVLTTAEMGRMDKMSTITVGEENILEGDMEEMLQHGVERIIRELPERPRMMMIFTSCIHHFMAVNYLGNCFPHTQEHCDLTALLEKNGIVHLEANSCHDYDQFLSMGESSVNFLFHATGMAAAKDLAIRQKQPYLKLRPGYDYEEFNEDLTAASEMLHIPAPTQTELEEARQITEARVQAVQAEIGSTPISIDYTAVDCPLELALYLLHHGFRVESVMVDHFTEREEVFQQLQVEAPTLRIYESYGWNIRKMPRGHDGKILCIGQKSAYFMDSDYFVNEVENAGMYGYRGIQRLMDLMLDAFRNPKPMKELVQIKGWECGCCE